MRFVHDDAFGCDRKEVSAVTIAFDVVETDDDHRVVFKKRDSMRKIFLNAVGASGSERYGLKVKMAREFGNPLIHQVRRTQNGETRDLAPVVKFADDQA